MGVLSNETLATRRQLLQCELTNGLEHEVARNALRGFVSLQQALVDEGGNPFSDVSNCAVKSRDGLGGLEGEATNEDGETTEKRALLWRKQVVTPRDGVAQGLLPIWGVARSSRQDVQGRSWIPGDESGSQLSCCQMSHASGCQLDCEWQPIEPAADALDICDIHFIEDKIRPGRLGAHHE